MPAFSVVQWAYKDEATSVKLQTMVDNLVAHDHRSDGTQGAPMIGEWISPPGIVAAAGWSLTSKRYRLLLGGAIVAYDFVATRTGAEIPFGTSGNPADVTVLTGLPVAAQSSTYPLIASVSSGPPAVFYANTDSIRLVGGVPSGSFPTNGSVYLRALAWTG